MKNYLQPLQKFLDIVTSEVSEKRKAQRFYKEQLDTIKFKIFDKNDLPIEILDISYTGIRFRTPPQWTTTYAKGETLALRMEFSSETHPINLRVVNTYSGVLGCAILDLPIGSHIYFENIFTKLVARSMTTTNPPGLKGLVYTEGANNSFACIERQQGKVNFFCIGFMSNFLQYDSGSVRTGRICMAFVSTNNIVVEKQEDDIEFDEVISDTVIRNFQIFVENISSFSTDLKTELIQLSRGNK